MQIKKNKKQKKQKNNFHEKSQKIFEKSRGKIYFLIEEF